MKGGARTTGSDKNHFLLFSGPYRLVTTPLTNFHPGPLPCDIVVQLIFLGVFIYDVKFLILFDPQRSLLENAISVMVSKKC